MTSIIMITTLFNLFCPLVLKFSITSSVYLMSSWYVVMLFMGLTICMMLASKKVVSATSMGLFPLSGYFSYLEVTGFLILSMLNLLSLICYSYPLTTTLGFNLSLGVTLWFSSVLIVLTKVFYSSMLVPLNSPWYLAPFLSLVELVSIAVRPITLSFRLLANMSAGHILLTLICKMNQGGWISGTLFGVLELMVCMVQAFVFLMLVSVYLEESFSH